MHFKDRHGKHYNYPLEPEFPLLLIINVALLKNSLDAQRHKYFFNGSFSEVKLL